MEADQSGTPLSIYSSLRTRLIAGEFTAGSRLKPDRLKQSYGCSASAMREILVRLTADGIVSLEEQRGFRVPASSEKHLRELTHLRVFSRAKGRDVDSNGDIEWEARLTAAHHKLAHIEKQDERQFGPRALRIGPGPNAIGNFHDTLMSACGSDLLRQTHRAIYDKFRQQVVSELKYFGFAMKRLSNTRP